MIFNVVVDAVICYWVTVVAPIKDGMEGLVLLIQDLAAYFYVDKGIVASTQIGRIQRDFDVLASLFDQVGLRTNTQETVSMACQP